MQPRRFRRLEVVRVLGREVPVARGPAARLLGLALLRRRRAGPGLLIPNCAAIHSFGMRFRIDVTFLDRRGRPLRRVRGLGPRRFVRCAGAAAGLEVPSGEV